MFGIPGTLELRLEVIGGHRSMFGDQAGQSFSEQQVEFGAQRIKPFGEGAILRPI